MVVNDVMCNPSIDLIIDLYYNTIEINGPYTLTSSIRHLRWCNVRNAHIICTRGSQDWLMNNILLTYIGEGALYPDDVNCKRPVKLIYEPWSLYKVSLTD